jgi:hypothetical protein
MQDIATLRRALADRDVAGHQQDHAAGSLARQPLLDGSRRRHPDRDRGAARRAASEAAGYRQCLRLFPVPVTLLETLP